MGAVRLGFLALFQQEFYKVIELQVIIVHPKHCYEYITVNDHF